jgi:hypothetical protein
MLGMPTAWTHPVQIPDTLFADPELERRWRQRFSAVRISLPGWARDAPGHTSYVSNETGRYEVYCWDVADGSQTVATERPDGTTHATLSADGRELWWFDDTDGDEFGSWRVQPFGVGPGSAREAMPGGAGGRNVRRARRVLRRRRDPHPPGPGRE